MEMLIAILLWLGCISAPNTYTQAAIDTYVNQNQPVINSVLESPTQQLWIWESHGSFVSEVDVTDPYN